MDEKMKKLNDDDLENVSGGSVSQNADLMRYLGIGPILNIKQISSLLRKNYGIMVTIDDKWGSNDYLDMKSGKEMTHDEVIARITTPNKKDPADDYLRGFLSIIG